MKVLLSNGNPPCENFSSNIISSSTISPVSLVRVELGGVAPLL